MPHAGHDWFVGENTPGLFAFQLTCPMRGTTFGSKYYSARDEFQLTCPMRGTTYQTLFSRAVSIFQLTCPMRGTTKASLLLGVLTAISTHVPHAGHDGDMLTMYRNILNFNSRAPCGARPIRSHRLISIWEFQLTCPMRGTTVAEAALRSPVAISTHVPHAGHDPIPP